MNNEQKMEIVHEMFALVVRVRDGLNFNIYIEEDVEELRALCDKLLEVDDASER